MDIGATLEVLSMSEGHCLDQAPPDARIEEVRRFALGALRASSSIFYWIDDHLQMQGVALSGLCHRNFHLYQDGMHAFDPLNVPRLVKSGRRISTLRQDNALASPAEFAHYQTYLDASRIDDVLDFVFWKDGFPFAGLGILKTPEDPPFCDEAMNLAASMQPYIEFNLASHPRLREQRLTQRLSSGFKLTRREIEVAMLLRRGCTNHDVVDELRISLGTVKSHVMRAFDKLGVENRTSLVSRLNQMESDMAPAV
jgi:DNA-binding CsgD family transcriptional regulator